MKRENSPAPNLADMDVERQVDSRSEALEKASALKRASSGGLPHPLSAQLCLALIPSSKSPSTGSK